MKEINATFTKKQNLLSDRNKGKRIIQDGNFIHGTFSKRAKGVKQRNLATSRVSLILVNLHPATAVKYSPFFGVNNLKSVSRIGGKMMEVNHTMYLSKMSAIVQANMRSPSGNCNATKTVQKNKW